MLSLQNFCEEIYSVSNLPWFYHYWKSHRVVLISYSKQAVQNHALF